MIPDLYDDLFTPGKTTETDNEKLFAEEESRQSTSSIHVKQELEKNWKILVVDDEEDVHSVTRMALKGFTYKNMDIVFFNTYSAAETIKILDEQKDIALVFLDVVMETNDAGLELVKYIRNKQNNKITQIVLRTGHPGQAPEREVIAAYEINDYKTKTELTSFKLFTVTLASLRAYETLSILNDLKLNLEFKVAERTAELEKRNVQIMEMDQMKTRFFTNISHEFRTPLTLILAPLESKLMQDELKEQEREELERMQRSGLRLLNLINQLQDLSRIDAGMMKLELGEHDILKTLKMISGSFVPLALRNEIDYVIDIPKDEFKTYFDYEKLEKIATNLLSNAFKFTPKQGKIVFTVKLLQNDNAGVIEIKLEDTGPGVPLELRKKIFERFYQIENAHLRTSGGTGIGLSLTQELVYLMKGKIELEGAEGKGSIFKVILPTGKDHLKPQEYVFKDAQVLEEYPAISKFSLTVDTSEKTEEKFIPEDGKPRILVVEDDDDLRDHLSIALANNYSLLSAENGKIGFETAITTIPDIIITDWMMPEMTGVELIQKLKTNEFTSHIPVIMLTAKAKHENKLEGLEIGADDYLTKPFNQEELFARIKNLVIQRRKLQELYLKKQLMEPGKVQVVSVEDKFLKRAKEVVENNISDCNFDVNTFYPQMNMSRMQLFRKLKALTNQSPSEFIRTIRLKRAHDLIKQSYGNIAEVTYEVGFYNLSYFSKCFRELFGVNPSEFAKQI